MRIIFWGTPEFALPSLRALLGEGHDVVAVVTQPDRPAGRGRTPRLPPVKRVAQAEMIPVLQPERPHGDAFLAELRSFDPEIFVVVAYGQILKGQVLSLSSWGPVNLHASLLPELRGAAPINWAIARGHERTGVTVMRMVERMDAGPILHQVSEPIGPEETAAELTARLSEIGAEALVEALALLEADALEDVAQDESRVTFAPRVTRDHARVDWNAPAVEIGRLLRAMDATPGAWTMLNGVPVKLFRPAPAGETGIDLHAAAPGTVLDVRASDAVRGMLVACGDGALRVREVQPPGRRRMTVAEWSRGRAIEVGARFQ